MKINDARVLITGAGRGIGNFIALGLLDKAAKVIVIDNNKELIAALPAHADLTAFECDITNAQEVEKLIRDIFENHGGVNICINNAGIIHSEPLVNLLSRGDKKHSIENWLKVMNVNLNAVFYVTSNVTEQMITKKEKGVIINISSISAQGNAGQSAYAATKAAVEALAKTWSKELGMFKIRAASIAPGFFNTDSTKESLSDHILQKWQKAVPLGKLGELEQLLQAVVFIIENDYYNGKTLSVDGGLTL
ncbi:MAG: SDR family NAD(P)-dependent oxidoreductase [Bacteroidota bacterium]